MSIALHAATQVGRLPVFTCAGLLLRTESHTTDHDSNSSGHAEQPDALANKDFQYLTKTYLPRKLKEKDWLD